MTQSTGPRTPEGKARSSRNATRHGLTSACIVLPFIETVADWDAHHEGILDALAPAGALEAELVERIAALTWRMRRVTRYETAIVATAQRRAERDAARDALQLALPFDDDEPTDATTLDALNQRASAASDVYAVLSRVRDLPDDAPVSGDDADSLLGALCDRADMDPTSNDLPEIPGVPTDRYWREWDGWTAGLLRVAAATFATHSRKFDSGEALYTATLYRAAAQSGAAKRQAQHATAALERLRAERVVPQAASADLVMRYETHLQRMLAVTLSELQRVRSMRATIEGTAELVG